jgi:hypothetical protein
MTSEKPPKPEKPEPAIGEPFNPYRSFTNIYIPLPMVTYRDISPHAKLFYGVLRKYGSKAGLCFPGQAKLAREMGVSER